MDISAIDKNFTVVREIDKTGLKFYDIDASPFRIYGVTRHGDKYYRIPEEIAKTVNPGVESLCTNTSGGRIRFVTNSNKLAIAAVLNSIPNFVHMPLTGVCGFDVYADDDYIKTLLPPYGIKSGEAFEYMIELDGKEHVITVNMPLYSGVSQVMIGICEGATLSEAPDYEYEQPIVYYGSSITQGGCASRPGMAYQAILSRYTKSNFINLGFSGNAKGEREMSEYISGLDMRAFVFDYDYNAPSWQHLENTHEPFFKVVRASHPDIPIIMLSRPCVTDDASRLERLEVIKRTYENAIAAGDKNVYFIDGSTLFLGIDNDFTVDGVHPTDLGFMYMAKGLLPVLMKSLKMD